MGSYSTIRTNGHRLLTYTLYSAILRTFHDGRRGNLHTLHLDETSKLQTVVLRYRLYPRLAGRPLVGYNASRLPVLRKEGRMRTSSSEAGRKSIRGVVLSRLADRILYLIKPVLNLIKKLPTPTNEPVGGMGEALAGLSEVF